MHSTRRILTPCKTALAHCWEEPEPDRAEDSEELDVAESIASSAVSRPSRDSSIFQEERARSFPPSSIRMSLSGSASLGAKSDRVFLRNPKTGGYDSTLALLDYRAITGTSGAPMIIKSAVDAEAGVNRAHSDVASDEVATFNPSLNDSTIYTTSTTKPLLQKHLREPSSSEHAPVNSNATKQKHPLQRVLSPRSLFHTKPKKSSNNSKFIPPEGASTIPVTPSPTKQKRPSILKQLTCRVTASPEREVGERFDATVRPGHNLPPSDASSEENFAGNGRTVLPIPHVRPAREVTTSAQNLMILNSPSRRQPQKGNTPPSEAMLVTPPRTGRSPGGRPASPPASEDSFFQQRDASNNIDHHKQGCASASVMSSILDFSFSTMGTSKKHKDDSLWTFDAISPVSLCGNILFHDDNAIECTFLSHSGFDADQSNSIVDLDYPSSIMDSVALDLLPHDALSLASAGAVLLTEAGLKRHNDKKLEQPVMEQLTLRQMNGVGKLEKEVLKQKVERLQAKEVKKLAESSLEEERAERKRRHLLAKQRQQKVASPSDAHEEGHVPREETPTKRNSPPRRDDKSPNSMSPQTSVGQTMRSPTKKNNSFFSKVRNWTKKPTAEDLKRQWKERERQRVQLAKQEQNEAERKERLRIEELRQSYLEKQRLLEAAAKPASTAKNTIDVDEYMEETSQVKSSFLDDATAKQGPHSPITFSVVSSILRKGSRDDISLQPTEDLPDLGSLTTMTPSFGPCAVCQLRERTHISMPCMHFAFCGQCVKNQTMCPLCTTENVTFSRVNTE